MSICFFRCTGLYVLESTC